MWEKELELIENLGKLYPEFNEDGYLVEYGSWQKSNLYKARWVYRLCKYHLNRRLPRLEEFIKENSNEAWYDYKKYFKIMDEQCGKKS